MTNSDQQNDLSHQLDILSLLDDRFRLREDPERQIGSRADAYAPARAAPPIARRRRGSAQRLNHRRRTSGNPDA